MAEAFCVGLQEIGFESEILNVLPSGAQERAIVLGACFYERDELEALTLNSIIFNVENTSSAFFSDNYVSMLRKFIVWDYSTKNAVEIEKWIGMPVFCMRPFYVESLTRIVDATTQDIDVLFFGSFNERRSKILDGLREQGLVVEAVYDVYGADLDQLIARSKIVINIHFYANGRSEMIRLFDLLANRRTIVAELNEGELVDADLRGAFVGVPYDRMIDASVALAHDAERRADIAKAGFEAFSKRRATDILREALEWSDHIRRPSDAVVGRGNVYNAQPQPTCCLKNDSASPFNPAAADFRMIGRRCGTDKIEYHGYHRFYPRFIESFRTVRGCAMLEIGIDKQHSLETWLDYYPDAFIYGIDIGFECAGLRYTIFKGDQSDFKLLEMIAKTKIQHPIFLILDDGSHIPEHQALSFDYLFRELLLPGGVYIIEDTETSYWTRDGLYGYQTRYGYRHPNSIIELFKNLVDDLNKEYLTEANRNAQNRFIGDMLSAETREAVSSITFGQNCIIITKKTEEEIVYDGRTYRYESKL